MKSTEKRVLTPEQIALSEERKRRKAEAVAKAAAAGPSFQQSHKTLPRNWLALENAILSKYPTYQAATVMSWNVSTVIPKMCFRRLYNNIQ